MTQTVIGTFNGYEMAVAVTYSTKINDQLGIGTSARIIYSHLADQGAGQEQAVEPQQDFVSILD